MSASWAILVKRILGIHPLNRNSEFTSVHICVRSLDRMRNECSSGLLLFQSKNRSLFRFSLRGSALGVVIAPNDPEDSTPSHLGSLFFFLNSCPHLLNLPQVLKKSLGGKAPPQKEVLRQGGGRAQHHAREVAPLWGNRPKNHDLIDKASGTRQTSRS